MRIGKIRTRASIKKNAEQYEIIERELARKEKEGNEMNTKGKNKFHTGEKVRLKDTGELVTISKHSYVTNMKRFSYTIKEHPHSFYFEEEIQGL